MVSQFRKLNFDDRSVSKFQENVGEALRPLTNCPLVGGHIIGPLNFVSGTATKVNHLLGRTVQGFVCIDKSYLADFFSTTSLSPELPIVLTSDSNVTASFWVF